MEVVEIITHELIDKINALWHKQKTVGLTDEEKEEQRQAREEYLADIRGQVQGMLESIKKPGFSESQKHAGSCTCKECELESN